MNRRLPALLLVFVCLLPACQTQDISQPPTSLSPIEVYFSPKGGCTEALVKELSAAKTSVLVQAYSFTSTRIAKSLLEAHKRGVKLEVVSTRARGRRRLRGGLALRIGFRNNFPVGSVFSGGTTR